MPRKKPPQLPALPTPGDWNGTGGGVGSWPAIEPPRVDPPPPPKPQRGRR